MLHPMDPIWAPHVIENLNDVELDLYIGFASTSCIVGGGCGVDEALSVLYQSNGDIKLAMQRLLSNQSYATWTEDEVHLFERLICVHGKNFYKISQDMKSKTVKECVLFYYKWKKSSRNNHSSSSSLTTDVSENRDLPKPPTNTDQQTQFPCKVCGRVFLKIKSRSAHMKRHKNER